MVRIVRLGFGKVVSLEIWGWFLFINENSVGRRVGLRRNSYFCFGGMKFSVFGTFLVGFGDYGD